MASNALTAGRCVACSVIDRVPDLVKLDAFFNHTADFTWHPSAALPNASIFTHLLGLTDYSAPPLLNWQTQNNSNPTAAVTAENVALLATFLYLNIQVTSTHSTTPNVMWPIGDDFQYQTASNNVCYQASCS